MTVQIEGLNLEKLLCEAQRAGIELRRVRRCAPRSMRAQISFLQMNGFKALCERFGWTITEVGDDLLLRGLRLIRKRKMLFAGAALCLVLLAVSSRMVLLVSVSGAQQYSAQVSRYLASEGASVGHLKKSVSFDSLREGLLLHLPELSQVEMRFSGSVLKVICHLTREGEQVLLEGNENDLIAAKDGIVTGMTVISGTPVVHIGEAVYAGQVLIKGEEATQKGGTIPVKAQGSVTARVFAHGRAKTSLYTNRAEETGQTRTRITIETPWYERVVRQAEPFEEQNVSVKTEKVIDLFIPLLRRIETFEEIRMIRTAKPRAEASSQAQGAAEKKAKKQLPAGVLILDKWVEYSMIDNEFVCADVIIEYEQDIVARSFQQ